MGDLHMKRLALHLVVPALGLWLVAGCVGTDTHLGVGNTAGLEAELQSVAGIDESADPNSAGVSAIDETFEAELTLDAAVGAQTALPLMLLPDTTHIHWLPRVVTSDFNLHRSGTPDSAYVTVQRTNDGLFI